MEYKSRVKKKKLSYGPRSQGESFNRVHPPCPILPSLFSRSAERRGAERGLVIWRNIKRNGSGGQNIRAREKRFQGFWVPQTAAFPAARRSSPTSSQVEELAELRRQTSSSLDRLPQTGSRRTTALVATGLRSCASKRPCAIVSAICQQRGGRVWSFLLYD